jgi:hypothetical protein
LKHPHLAQGKWIDRGTWPPLAGIGAGKLLAGSAGLFDVRTVCGMATPASLLQRSGALP